jgi:ribokinase
VSGNDAAVLLCGNGAPGLIVAFSNGLECIATVNRSLTVVGSVNLDLVARVAHLPAPGETVTGATLSRHPGGKGANQALAARRLGAAVRLIACVGRDAMADEALQLLRADRVELGAVVSHPTEPTGVALIAVSVDGENQIVVAPGANRALRPEHLLLADRESVLAQLEIPADVIAGLAARAGGFFALNVAPALPLDRHILNRADLLIANEIESRFYGAALHAGGGLVAVTRGAAGAALYRRGSLIAEAPSPRVAVVDSTGAGDAFSAALTVALLEGRPPQEALRFACATGACAVCNEGAQSSLPHRTDVEALLA